MHDSLLPRFPRLAVVWTLGLLLFGALREAQGEVVRVETASTTPYLEGREFEEVGSYVVVRGKVFFEVDPSAPANRTVVDLTLAPRNERGKVEFSADFELLRPADLTKARGTVLYDVNNRGKRLAQGMFNSGADEFLCRNGFIVAWSGWIAETQPGDGRLRLQAPTASYDGQPIRGKVRAEVVVDAPTDRWTLSQWINQGSYPPTAQGEREAVLTWRQREGDVRRVIPRDQWRFEQTQVEAEGQKGQLPTIELVVPAGLRPGWIYEVVYEAEGPIVQGLGMTGVRDWLAFLRHDEGPRNPLLAGRASAVRNVLGFGVSQSGRMLRTFLYDGFNADEQGRQVFDGVMPHVAGGGLGFYNHRFAAPTRTNGQHENHLYPADVFPFTYHDQRDPLTGRVDGVLRRATASNTAPKVMHTQSSSEYWHRAGSLVHTDPLSTVDAPPPENVRIYTFGGTQHGSGSGVPAGDPSTRSHGAGQAARCPADYRPLLRGLLMALEAWTREGKEPPPSVYPTIAAGDLAPWREEASGWRPLPGVRYPSMIHEPAWVDRGPEYAEHRRTTIEPPTVLGKYPTLVPGFDRDGHERGCLDVPAVAASIGTYVGWNLRSPQVGAEGELLTLSGSFLPFPSTAESAQAVGDPRRSLAERYPSESEYLAQHQAHALRLLEQGYLLDEDVSRLESLARRLWVWSHPAAAE